VSNFEPYKLLSIKLASLSSKDQKWILSQIPQGSRDKISQTIRHVKTFKVSNKQDFFEQLLAQSPECSKTDLVIEKTRELPISAKLNKHFSFIESGVVPVTEDIKLLISSFLDTPRT
jgi:hypothetical protein